MNHLLRLLAAHVPTEPRGGHTCHSVGRASDDQRGVDGDISRGL